jgi:uncharacterized membrane-anchored protein YitT (DUF2179 family)
MSDAMWGISEAALRGLITGLALGALVSVILIVKAACKFLISGWGRKRASVAPATPATPPPEDGMMDIAVPARPAKSHDILVTALIIGVLLGLAVAVRNIYG